MRISDWSSDVCSSDLPSSIKGTGRDGRLTKDDVLNAAKSQGQAVKTVTAQSAPGTAGGASRNEERVRMTRLRQTIAARRKEAQNTASTPTPFHAVALSTVMAARTPSKIVSTTCRDRGWPDDLLL